MDQIIEMIKGIDWEQVIATVKDIAEKAMPIIEKVIKFIADNVG